MSGGSGVNVARLPDFKRLAANLGPRVDETVRWARGLRGPRLIVVSVAAGFVVFMLWAAIARVDEVTRGQGRVIPSSKSQLIQSAEPAVVKDILVRVGQRVRKNQLLVRMDDTQSSSELGQIEAQNRSLQARAARLNDEATGEAEAGGVDAEFDCPPEVAAAGAQACANEALLQRLRQQALETRQRASSALVEQRRRELGEAQATVSSLRSSQSLAQQQVDMLRPLAQRRIVPETELLTAQRELTDIQGRLAAAQQSVSRAAAAVREAQAQAESVTVEFRQEAVDELNQLNEKLAVIEESRRGAAGRRNRAELRSPVDGVVNDVQVTTVGGFVNAGQKIMEVVPLGEKLLVEARIRPQDIAFVRVGQEALVKVTAYDFSRYGGLRGRVVQVSADSIYDEREREAYFSIIVETDESFLRSGGRQLPITPGMICDVEVLTGRKSVLAYLMKPVTRARQEALRER